jgi:integrase
MGTQTDQDDEDQDDEEERGVSHATADRMMGVVRAVLRKCAREWGWLTVMPVVPMYRPEEVEPRWLTPAEFKRLCSELPPHLELAAHFAVETGLRMRAMLRLTWDRIDIPNARLRIPGKQMKGAKALGISLSELAIAVLIRLKTANPEGPYVFQYEGAPIDNCNTAAFRKALIRAGINTEGMKRNDPLKVDWHTLRHTFATWALQDGVTLEELQKLGGWKDYRRCCVTRIWRLRNWPMQPRSWAAIEHSGPDSGHSSIFDRV